MIRTIFRFFDHVYESANYQERDDCKIPSINVSIFFHDYNG